MLLKRLWRYIRSIHDDLQAWVAQKLVVRQVTKVLKLTHAQELANAPRNEWPLLMRRQQEEIQAVASGQIDIIDRRTWAFPYLPEALHRLNQPILKNTPHNLRRFSETPIPRRAINLIKNSVLSFDHEVVPTDDTVKADPEMETRIRILKDCLERPNNQDSFNDLFEAVLEDLIIGGYGCIEARMTPYYKRPFKLWAVDGSTIRIFMDWAESTPDRPRYAQMTGLKGERGIVTFLANELIYIRDNVRTSTPFGLGKLEVAFNTVNAFLGAQDMASRAGSDQVHKTFLWWEQTLNPQVLQTVRRYITNDLEGQAKISLIAGAKSPNVVDVQAVKPEDLLLDWQEFTIRIIANAFDISPLSLGLERDVNRNTGQVMADADFRNAVVPMARRLQDALTRYLVHGYMGWKDLKFQFSGLEDFDVMTRIQINRAKYACNAITPDEIRNQDGDAPMPGGWGKLTQGQMMILIQQAAAQAKGAAGGTGAAGGAATGARLGTSSGMGGAMPSGMGSSGGGFGSGGGMVSLGNGSPSTGMKFSAQDVAAMLPEEIEMYQQLGLLPPTQQLGQEMENVEPGILEKLTDELREFFEKEEEEEEEMQVQPAPITKEDEAGQQQRFKDAQHEESYAEKVINRRAVFGPGVDQSVRKNATRGKYEKDPKGHFRPGKNNPYR